MDRGIHARASPDVAGVAGEVRIAPSMLVRTAGGCRSLLVDDHRPPVVRRILRRVLHAGLPVDLIPAEEREIHAGIARGLHSVTLLLRPVLVVPDREECLMLEELGGAEAGVEVRRVADVVAVALEPADHGVFGGEEPVLLVAATSGERTVVAELLGVHAGGSRAVGVVPAVGVVGLPGRVRGLGQEIGAAVVVAHDEDDVARPSVVGSRGPGDVDAGCRIGRHTP